MKANRQRLLDAMRKMDSSDFELLVAEVWEAQNWSTQVSGGNNDRGVDIIAEKPGEFSTRRQLIQAKNYTSNNKVGSKEIQRYAGLYARSEDVDKVFVVTSGEFTQEAAAVAENRDVGTIAKYELVDYVLNIDDSNKEKYINDSKGKVEVQKRNNTTTNHPFSKERIATSASPVQSQNLMESCPECTNSNTLWFSKQEDGTPLLKCDECLSAWMEVQNRGLIFTTTMWKEYQGPMEGKVKDLEYWNTIAPEEYRSK